MAMFLQSTTWPMNSRIHIIGKVDYTEIFCCQGTPYLPHPLKKRAICGWFAKNGPNNLLVLSHHCASLEIQFFVQDGHVSNFHGAKWPQKKGLRNGLVFGFQHVSFFHPGP